MADTLLSNADSEHSAIFQCIQGLPEKGLRRIILTASGGAFRDWPVEKLKHVKVSLVGRGQPGRQMFKSLCVHAMLCDQAAAHC